jgi:hypothetical protein
VTPEFVGTGAFSHVNAVGRTNATAYPPWSVSCWTTGDVIAIVCDCCWTTGAVISIWVVERFWPPM